MLLKGQIPNNPELREKLMPNYEFGCKRVSPSNAYFKALSSAKCNVIREGITRVTGTSIITEDGKEHVIDVRSFCYYHNLTQVMGTSEILRS